MGFGLGYGLGLRNQLAFGRGLPYTIKNKLLFLGNYSAIADGKMPNTLGSDWITVAGVSGSETYTCPNTASYIAADADYVWFDNSAVIKSPTTEILIGANFQRTLIKYSDFSDGKVDVLAIMKAGSVFDEHELIVVHNYFKLSLFWSGLLHPNGHLKYNRMI